ncbi:phosphate ABC transporter substrate-binding protein, PhoT family [Nitrosomonas marina]|uniref:Phosphate ABC transporter substrate-binding protein, PhoT family n=1 Tax=Nitrosomonas marina TaxID=917 RepID=A0A1I0F6Q5_9PROT|nr:PstS family phosphate ABC transporter substrate-binding protein [Nitrosomonas marina]SET53123.1 phosphate ABC transporter substrate-binding protein, PhoT family [Nitrosomonas marina]
MSKRLLILTAMLFLVSSQTHAQAVRDYISIVGSSTVYPFATVVAETFGKTTQFKTPKIESTGSGGGFKLFCDGIGVKYPDITDSSRAIKQSEIDMCATNGVTDIIEIKIGYDGIVIANSKETSPFGLSRKDLFLALAKQIPDPENSGELTPNPHKTWKEINDRLPNIAIEVLGPPPTSGTRDAFVELAMEAGCSRFDWIETLKKTDKKQYQSICHTIREDGAYIEAGENDNLIVQKLETNPHALGIFGFSFLEQNTDKVQGLAIDGILPEFEAIADNSYPVSRPLFLYVKKSHVGMIPGIQAFLNEFTSEKAWGEDGYLTDKGLIPMTAAERDHFTENARQLRANIFMDSE